MANPTTFAELIALHYQGGYIHHPLLDGRKVILTGTMSARRDAVQDFLILHGAVLGSTVARSDATFGLLVVANHEWDAWKAGHGGSAKITQAHKYGVDAISESDLVAELCKGDLGLIRKAQAAKVIAPQPEHYGDF